MRQNRSIDGRGANEHLDPTKVTHQPALQSSSGRSWLIMGSLFLLASLVPLSALIFVRQGPSTPMAVTTAISVVLLYLAMVVSRITIAEGRKRLVYMASFMLSMAAVALVGVFVCFIIEQQAV